MQDNLVNDRFHSIALLECSYLGIKQLSRLKIKRCADWSTNIKRKKQQEIALLLFE